MDWKRVKTILIALLLVTNLILGYSVYGQFRSLSRTQADALSHALAQAGPDSGLTPQMLDAVPEQPPAYAFSRDLTAEHDFARRLLGEEGFSSENTGGGIVQYTGARGSGEIKNGGEMSFSLFVLDEIQPDADFPAALAELLRQAGLDVGEAEPSDAGALVFSQRWDGLPLDRYALTATAQDETLRLSGRWLICREAVPEDAAPSRAELVLRLSAWLAEDGLGPALGLWGGYYVQENRVLPVWYVALESGQRVFGLLERRAVR